jgi:hypothetical protein
MSISGPKADGHNVNQSYLGSAAPTTPYRGACGTGIIRFKTELRLTSSNSTAKGTVDNYEEDNNGKLFSYGIEQGVTWTWEKCN